MSVVLSFANKEIAIIASDGRAVDNDNNIVFENFDKTRKVNDHVLIGFAGDANVCKNISDLITNPENKDFVATLFVEDIIGFIEECFKKAPPNIECGFIVSGIGKNGKICVGNVSTYQTKEITYPDGNDIAYQGLYPKEIPQNIDIYRTFLSQQPPMEATISTIKLCAKLSHSVNEVIHCVSVRLPD